MKTIIILISFLCSLQAHALACKCSCDPVDRRICASYYDIDHPCGTICPGAIPGSTPMITACPVRRVIEPFSQAYIWVSSCPEDKEPFNPRH